jgi:hypothetical protein
MEELEPPGTGGLKTNAAGRTITKALSNFSAASDFQETASDISELPANNP